MIGAMDDHLSAAATMSPEHWAALHGIAAVVNHIARSAPAGTESQTAVSRLAWLLNNPADRTLDRDRGAWRPAGADSAPEPSPSAGRAAPVPVVLSSRSMRGEIETAIAPLAGSVSTDWLARAVSVLDHPGLLIHARRSLLTLDEQVAIADAFEPRRVARDDEEARARAMREMAATPEEWVARYGHHLWFRKPFELRYANPETDRWMASVYAVHESRSGPDTLRAQFLTPEEWAGIEAVIHSPDYEP